MAQTPGMCKRSFRWYLARDEAEGLDSLINRGLDQVPNRRVPLDELMVSARPDTFD